MSKCFDLGDDEQFDADKDSDPLDALKKLRKDYECNDDGHRENRWRLIERATATSERLKEDQKDIDIFVKDKSWKEKPYKPKKDQITLLCMQYMVDAPNFISKSYKTAYDYTKAVKILQADGSTAKEIFAQSKVRGGPYAVIEDDREDEPEDQRRASGAKDDKTVTSNGSPNATEKGNSVTRTIPKEASSDSSVISPPVSTEKSLANNSATSGRVRKNRVRIFDPGKHIAVTGWPAPIRWPGFKVSASSVS